MTIKNKSNKNSTNLIIIIITSMVLFLGTYVWIHHQTLTETETNLISHHKKLEIQNKNLQEMKDKLQQNKDIIQNQITNTNKESQETTNTNLQQLNNQEESNFHPSNNQKFPSFDQLIGFKEEKQAVEGFIDYLNNKENYINIGEVDSPLGILMYGIPGTGKTTLARALAKETKLPFFEVSSSLFSQKYKGLAPQMVKDLFEAARKEAAKNNGAIIFLDECETIFTDLGTLEAGSEIANVVNQFKTEMTSFENNPEKPIFIIGATNHIDQIDEAIKSRFTYNIEVKPGNKEERKEFLEFLIKKRKNPYSEEAKQYLYEVINEALERLPVNQEFKKVNRTLENLLKTTVTIFAKNRGQGETRRNQINQEDLKQAYKMIISQDDTILNTIEQEIKPKGDE
ncbi:ATP-dependent Zn protease [Candidatus Phytoplasma ziziphi]|uniref:ATP-dependent Zn protease n=1 Tax=Ziziphus jujuba witches'-broom phytoplasma TaxID=135727 RepID=A0A660HNT6_ZIZJU|nr:ATP-binding protein [Candidatus Phytoplasma ziziphi]AYJ01456.1 ATP-dependent Zn protease [Candidatus Phytoplasma ziziphi]